MRLQKYYDLSPALARILALLIDNEVVTPEMIQGEQRAAKDAKVAVHRLRQRLLGMDIDVKSRRDLGYWLDAPVRRSFKAWLESDDIGLPLRGGGDGALSSFPQSVS